MGGRRAVGGVGDGRVTMENLVVVVGAGGTRGRSHEPSIAQWVMHYGASCQIGVILYISVFVELHIKIAYHRK
jgi:uncharacterized membrane protein YkvI